MEALCTSVVKRIKDALGWQGEIIAESNVGVWTGALPNYLRMVVEDSSNYEDNSTISSPSEDIDADMKTSAQDIATYQVIHVFKIDFTMFLCLLCITGYRMYK